MNRFYKPNTSQFVGLLWVQRQPTEELISQLALTQKSQTPLIADEIRKVTNGNYALGNAVFATQIAQALGGRVTAGKAGRPKNLISCKQRDEFLHTKL